MRRCDQAAAIPFRWRRDGIQLCLIRNRGGSRWKIPKGFIEAGDRAQETALKEAWEEAGLKGRVVGEAIGTYEYQKWGRSLTVAVFLMEVSGEEDEWEESRVRVRDWTALDAALTLLKKHPAHELLEAAAGKLERRRRPR